MEQAKSRRMIARDNSHNYYRMLAQKPAYLKEHKEKSFTMARTLGAVRYMIKHLLIYAKCDQIVRKMFLLHKKAFRTYTAQHKLRLVVMKIKMKMRM
jgi:hypothetical protein